MNLHSSSPPLTDEDRWRIVRARDRRYDGAFLTGVHSTGIYCRPSCPARTPLRRNVRFYADAAAAEAAGLRPCKRCAPDRQSRDEAAVLAALALLREAEEAIPLDQLARHSGYSPTHFQRIFTRAIGLSPAAYQRALRRERAGAALESGGSVTEAIYSGGYGAASRFYEDRKDIGMTAGEWRDGGRGRTIHWAFVSTTMGEMLVAATDRGVCCLSFGESEPDLRRRFPNAELVEGGEEFRALFEQVAAAVETPGTGADIPLDVKGTAFQQRVWQALREIPAGETRSYGQLAAALGNPKASRAVGGANGANNIAVLIPCHRVIAADGGLGGYAYGTTIKSELLRRERRS
ncbi:bifunctional DNA-binding transcriptional regulator/O6-methylguanine-DNA methyltransferase Ada [Qipengyuania spongiae]|uniref:Bifunctional DNA-binding transcriptional regulator/O6-methylguanine-DNA methyltransferase Ada n=1 Tax=Qipengyuania spongiae TaxID=2909673 RepID=A0ABY5SU33_9SPHN|nr:bifunctional DNA-binding transcriptional regulator/O6-methylguanine-DNA methyltransferase Ada [Qipengyuania spongiae]UVI38078.1 bifunctional DNA-binding transcriptional regulator/O6-methylguanine-DNA methyltransferase Ada [Qipengyuania spongiae]